MLNFLFDEFGTAQKCPALGDRPDSVTITEKCGCTRIHEVHENGIGRILSISKPHRSLIIGVPGNTQQSVDGLQRDEPEHQPHNGNITLTVNTAKTDDIPKVPGGDIPPFQLGAIERTKAPAGAAGDNWCRYKIEQGPNTITGYRQGSPRTVKKAVADIITDLNERRAGRRGRVNLKPSGRPKKAAS
jgi:hypothetical protein